jgi:hypothetical protein
MKNILAKSAAVFAAASIIAVNIMPVLADTATNDTTGHHSSNTTKVENTNNVKVTNVSDASITNTVKTTSNTGGNFASENTMGGMIQTGDAVTDVKVFNNANINTTILKLGRNSGENTAGSSVTGAESTNKAEIENTNDVDVRNDNTAVVKNDVTADSNTGGNMANENTDSIGGKVQTGDALATVSLKNRVNDSATAVEGLADFGYNMVGNSITGHHSLNEAEIENNNDITVRNVSDASVLNKARATSNTGGNFASENTMGGMVQSGDSGVDLALETDANIVTTNIEAGMPDSDLTSGNSLTGDESINSTELENTNEYEVVNRNNKGSSEDAKDYDGVKWGVVNMDDDSANTGGNIADENTYPGGIASGIASIGKFIRVCLNDTFTSVGGELL